MILEILKYPNPFLRKKAKPVSNFDPSLKSIVDNMFETMADARGIGLAATQVGIDLRIFVMNTSGYFSEDVSEEEVEDVQLSKTGPLTVINPEIVSQSGKISLEEGCLSIPGIREEVPRKLKIQVRFQNVVGETLEQELEELDAVCFQHELDHLDGKLFIDRLPMIRREMIKRQLKKQT